MRSIFTFILIQAMAPCFSQVNLDYYLPRGEMEPGIPEPKAFFGHEIGEWHLSHDKLTWYLKELAERSDRVEYQEYATSYENRPLFHLVITSPENHRRLEEIRLEHLKLSDPDRSSSLPVGEMPLVVRLGYGVHGNESSASNASVLVAYFLAASRSGKVSDYLDSMVILLDPCLNPDGFNRHASWVNMHKSMVPMRDGNSRGFSEPWPGGRTNHYWFDLNRDWILLQHPETRGRVRVFHDWKPNVVTDHHEMGASSSFFFQPGVPSRINPHTPQRTSDLTRRIGLYHARALDWIGTLYFTEERFDDFYYGKGSSYPDVNGSVGILFEQAGTRGFERETSRGRLSFPYAIRNQVRVSLSTLEASLDMRKDLLEHQRWFYRDSERLFKESDVEGYLFGENGDPSTLNSFLEVLLQHRIEVRRIQEPITLNATTFTPSASFLVPMDQPQIRLVKSLFEPVLEFTDSLFYDISAWTLPYAFNIPYESITSAANVSRVAGEPLLKVESSSGHFHTDSNAVGYMMPWNDYHAPGALYSIQQAGLITQVAEAPIGYGKRNIERSFGAGTIFIPLEKQFLDPPEIEKILRNTALETGIDIYSLTTSYTSEGVDMGSQRLLPLTRPKILLLTGEGVSSLEAGEIWHLLDTRMGIPVVLTELQRLNQIDLSAYTHILMPSGGYGEISDAGKQELERWVKRGGTVIALKSANRWLAENGFSDLKFKTQQRDTTTLRPYGELNLERGATRISGTIFEAEIDLTHPIGFGLDRDRIPLFRNSTLIAEPLYKPYAVPVRYTQDPLLSGYVQDDTYNELRGTPAVMVSSLGAGRIISFMDNPNFRGFLYGANRLFMNAIFFGPVISEASTR